MIVNKSQEVGYRGTDMWLWSWTKQNHPGGGETHPSGEMRKTGSFPPRSLDIDTLMTSQSTSSKHFLQMKIQLCQHWWGSNTRRSTFWQIPSNLYFIQGHGEVIQNGGRSSVSINDKLVLFWPFNLSQSPWWWYSWRQWGPYRHAPFSSISFWDSRGQADMLLSIQSPSGDSGGNADMLHSVSQFRR